MTEWIRDETRKSADMTGEINTLMERGGALFVYIES